MEVCREMLDSYEHSHFILSDNKLNMDNVVARMTRILFAHGLKITNQMQIVEGFIIYPKEYMCPICTTDGQLRITDNTFSIHHYAASWTSPTHRLLRKLLLTFGGVRLKMWLGKRLQR